MKPELDDLRALRLAELHERAYERFVRDVAEHVADEGARADLAGIAASDDAARIAAEIERLRAKLSPEDAADAARASLLDVLDVERAGLEFYVKHVDAVHDPALVQLFHDLAQRKRDRIHVAETILDEHTLRTRRVQRPSKGVET